MPVTETTVPLESTSPVLHTLQLNLITSRRTIQMNPDDLKLCYVDKCGFAWFTTCPLELQWGDDWDDAPYEHNAGDPYDHHRKSRGAEPVYHETLKVAYESDHETPCSNHCNSPWSVKSINARNVAWLSVPNWKLDDGSMKPLFAGATLREFIQTIETAGGEVYLPRTVATKFWSELNNGLAAKDQHAGPMDLRFKEAFVRG